MTSSNFRVRRAAFVATAAFAASGLLAACGSGQITQTSSQVAAVDGGSGQAGDVWVNDFRVVVDDENVTELSGEGQVGFVVSYAGAGFSDDQVTLDSVTIDGQDAQINGEASIGRNCSIIAKVDEGSQPEDIEEGHGGTCFKYVEVSMPDVSDLQVAVSVPATLSFSNGDEIELDAGVVVAQPEPRSFDREDPAFPDNMAHNDH